MTLFCLKPALFVVLIVLSSLHWELVSGWLFSSSDAATNTLVQENILNSRLVLSDAEQAEREISPTNVRGSTPRLSEVYQQGGHLCGEEKVGSNRVNDNYCDCDDGSDEPGTAACAGRTLAQFYCNNFGYKSLYVPSSKVDDGFCDCCDGSDEPPGTCQNVCEEVGREYRKNMEKQMEERLLGLQRKQEYILSAKEALENTDSRKAALHTELAKLKQELPPLEEELAKLEEAEQKATEEQQRRLTADRIVSLKLNDLSAEELQKIAIELAERLSEGPILEEIVRSTFLRREESPAEAELQVEWLEEHIRSEEEAGGGEETPHAEESDTTTEDTSPDQVNHAENARERVQELRGQVESFERDVHQIEEEKDTDYGKSDEFWAIKDKCYSVRSDEYNYEFCMYGNAQQDSVNLGSWNGFEDDHSTISFTKGTRCWNGPERSLTIKLECGGEERFHSVKEPSTCEYTGVFTTAAACN